MVALRVPGRLPDAPLQLCYPKNTLLTFYTHPDLGGCQNNSMYYTVKPLYNGHIGPCKTGPYNEVASLLRALTKVASIQRWPSYRVTTK